MRGRGMGMAAPAKRSRTGTDKVGKWTCDKYEGTANGQKVADLCTVDPTVLGLLRRTFRCSGSSRRSSRSWFRRARESAT